MMLSNCDGEPWPDRYVVRGWHPLSRPPPLSIVRAEGIFVEDNDGKRYADLSSQLVSTNLGHDSTRVRAAVASQMEQCSYVSPEYGNPVRESLSKKLCSLLPPGFDSVLFTTGGTSGINAAIAAAMHHRGATGIVSRYMSYHGSTGTARAISSSPRTPSQQTHADGNVIRMPVPHCMRCPLGLRRQTCRLACVAVVRSSIEAEGPESVAAIVAETVTGTSGVVVPPPGYYEAVRALCDEYGILWIADEVMTGFGRTGKMFAFEHWNAVPDMVVMAKGLTASFLPLGAVAFTYGVSSHFEDTPFPMGQTYSGHPVSCAAAHEVLALYEDYGIVNNAVRLGKVLSSRLTKMASTFECIDDVRGIGCLWALDFYHPDMEKNMAEDLAMQVCASCLEKGVLLLRRESMVIVAPPLVTTISELKPALDVIAEAIEDVQGE